MKIKTLCITLFSGIILWSIISAIQPEKSHPMIREAKAFIQSLTDEQKEECVFLFDDRQRTIWNYLPPASVPRTGLSLKALNEEQDQLVFNLLKSGLSERGYLKTEQIIALEDVLKILENNNPGRDRELYFLAIYGDPSDKGTWSWHFTGHHLSLNFTIVDGHIATSPTFMGANPAHIKSGPQKGLRVLGQEEDLGFALIESMTDSQQQMAIILNSAPADILTAQQSEVEPLEKAGISFHELSDQSQQLFKKLIEEYITVMPPDLAKIRKEKIIAAGWDPIHFAWAGPIEKGKGHYYRVQGPSFIIEFDNVQTQANHIHAVWRDFEGDFGRDLLREHYQNSPHHQKH